MGQQNIAVIGCGYWGKNLVRNMAELGVLAAVCDANDSAAQAMAQQHGVRAATLDAILTNPAIAGVVIATSAATHVAVATQALNAGKHVFVEKPIALRTDEAEQLAALAVRQKRVLMVGHLLHYHPVYAALKSMVANGDFGTLQQLQANRLNFGKVRTEENVLWSFAPHDISMLLGLVDIFPETVSAQAQAVTTPGVADHVHAHMRFANGLQATLHVSWLHPTKEQKLVVVGSEQMAVFDDGQPWDKKLAIYRHRVDHAAGYPVAVKAEPTYVVVPESEPLRNECRHFLAAMEGAPVITDATEATAVLQLLTMIEEAMNTGKTVRPGVPSDVWVHETAMVDAGCDIGAGTKIWHFAHILKGTRMGRDCVVGQNVMIGPDVVVGDRCKIQNNVSLYKGVTLEDGVFCGPSCVFTNVNTPRADIERKDEYLPTRVGRAATIGANATIVCGHDIGAYALIGAGSVVTKHVKPHALMVGNPARQIGWVSHAGERLGDDLTCPREGRRYRIEQDCLVEITNGQHTQTKTVPLNIAPAALDVTALEEKFAQGKATIAILGMGYVGFPLAIATHAKGYDVLAFDIDMTKVDQLNAGKSYLRGIEDAVIGGMVTAGRFHASATPGDLARADALILCVPTPLTKNREPDMSYVVATTETVASVLRPGQLVVLESTTYPGTMQDVVIPILERTGLTCGKDFFVAYSPEREDPGNGFFSTHTIPKVVGGDDPLSLKLAEAMYSRIVTKAVVVKSSATAEAVKLTENIFRSVNIALVNELKIVFERMGIDIWDVIEAAKTKPFGYMPFYPGPGVGGHCIPIDPFYLTWKSREFGVPTRFIELAGQINERMPGYVIDRLREGLDRHCRKGLNGSRILVLGIAYKKDVDDMRESPSLFIFERLKHAGAEVDFHDPCIAEIPMTREHKELAGLTSVALSPAMLATYEAVVIATDHTQVDYAMIAAHSKLIVDTRNIMSSVHANAPVIKA